MAEAQRFADLGFGSPGHVSYIPAGEDESEPGSLHSSRILTNYPRFKQIGSSAELYPPSKKGLPPQTHAKLSAERNLQRRWLLKSHPEAFMGNEVLSELLTDDLRRFPDADEPSATQALLAIGEISDLSIPSKPRATRILAVATGNSGESLRLAHVEDSEWIWDEDTDSVLHLSVLDSVDNFEEAIWSSDGLPISQIKFVSDNSTSDPIRWLLVQKQTSTVILSPRYDKHPRTRGRSKQQTVGPTELSRINPNPLVTLGHQETGGNAHIDVAFNAPADGRPPQLCVMDECGYWTLWNVIGKAGWGSGSWRLSLCKCGHIFEGSLQEIPSTSLYPAKRHGAFLVGTSQAGGEEDPFSGFESQEGSLRRSAHLLAWNAERIEIMDVRTDALLAKLDIITTEVKHGRILDVQASPVSQNHIFVLTTRYVIWVDVFFTSPGSESSFQPLALLTCPHLAVSHEGLKLSVGPVSDNDAVTSMLFVYATKEAQVSIFWFRLEEHGLPEWHRQIAPLLPSRKSNEPPVQLVTFQPVRLECSEDAEGIGAKYQEEGGQFYQGMILDDNLGLKYCMGYSSKNPVVSASLPTTRLGWTKPDQHRKWRRKRERILRHMGSHFVVPDHMLHLDRQLVPWAPPNYDEPRPDELGSDPHRNAVVSGSLRFHVEQLAGVLRESMYSSTSQRFTGIPVALVDTIQGLIQHGRMAGTLPLRTWLDASADVVPEPGAKFSAGDDEALGAIQAMFGEADAQTVLVQLAPGAPATDPLSSFGVTRAQLDDIWLAPLRDVMSEEYIMARESWVAELATDMTLTTYGVAVQDAPLFSSPVPASAQPTRVVSSPIPIPSSPQIPSSQISARNAALSSSQQSPRSPSPGPNPDEAFERLRLLAPGIQPGKIGGTKPADLLSYWPTERGVDIREYVSSVAIAEDRKFDDARQRLQKIETRRKAFADKYKRASQLPPPSSSSLRQDFGSQAEQHQDSLNVPIRPAAPMMGQIMSSQAMPGSSQSQGPPQVTMSQPVSGAFGERKKAKKKKKSGFR